MKIDKSDASTEKVLCLLKKASTLWIHLIPAEIGKLFELVFLFIILSGAGDGSGDNNGQLGFAQGPLSGLIILIVLGVISAFAFYIWEKRK